MFKRKQSKHLKIDTLIGSATRIDGDLSFVGGLHLDGYINGNVSVQVDADGVAVDGTLWVSESGGIEGWVRAPTVVLNGLVKGDIDATVRLELGEKARVLGNVRYGAIESAVGAQINGKLVHLTASGSGEGDTGPNSGSSL